MPIKQTFSKNDKLINFLNDNGEMFNGMYLAAACQKFIEWQNLFLKPILEVNMFNGILHNYVNTISKKIPVQEAKKEQTVLINERFKNYGKYIDFNDVIYAYSERNIFGENGQINYSNYNTFIYDYDSIEEELGKIILPGVCLFEKETMLNFVTYWGEGFRGGKSQMIIKLYSKYKQEDLNKDEKQIVFDYISNMNKNNLKKGNENKNYDFKNFFASMQMLIFYLTEKGVMKEEETINKVIKNALAETLQKEYRAPIDKDIKDKIIEKFIKKNVPKDPISIKNLGTAVRRLISRYLAGKLETTDIKEDRILAYDLSREEFWEEKIGKLENLIDLLDQKFKDFQLTVGQAYEFYQIIGDEDRNTLNFNK